MIPQQPIPCEGAIDSEFSPDERLFRRLNPAVWFRFGGRANLRQIWNDQLPFPTFSVNREKYSNAPEDVLQPEWPRFANHAIGVLVVGRIPPEMVEGSDRYVYAVEHCPENGNIAHSEIRCYRNGARLLDKDAASKTMRVKFRALLGERMDVYREPIRENADGAA